jgi:protein-L-isoaspartate(D-aspartate) O-methyltransferase
MPLDNNTEFARTQMVAQQVRGWEVLDERVLDVLRRVPREHFVPSEWRRLAFAETFIPLGHDQFMMPPSLEGRMLQALELSPQDEVLEIGTGSGFVTACLARLARFVVSVEFFPDLSETAGKRLAELGIENVRLLTMDATRDLPDGSFDAVAVTGSLPLFDTRFVQVLKPGGRLFVITGTPPVMEAQLVVRGEDDRPEVRSLFETNVPPLVNAPSPPAFRF